MSQRTFIIGMIGLFVVAIIILMLSEYFNGPRPFTKGLYRKSFSGRILSVSIYKTRATTKVSVLDTAISFLPEHDPVRIGHYFEEVVQQGDSIWKKPMSDTIYTISNGIIYSWPFSTKDKFGRSYLDEELK